jgi:hypothetical protein
MVAGSDHRRTGVRFAGSERLRGALWPTRGNVRRRSHVNEGEEGRIAASSRDALDAGSSVPSCAHDMHLRARSAISMLLRFQSITCGRDWRRSSSRRR